LWELPTDQNAREGQKCEVHIWPFLIPAESHSGVVDKDNSESKIRGLLRDNAAK
jgi:hypothetical protein